MLLTTKAAAAVGQMAVIQMAVWPTPAVTVLAGVPPMAAAAASTAQAAHGPAALMVILAWHCV
jgi:hypothetical protein